MNFYNFKLNTYQYLLNLKNSEKRKEERDVFFNFKLLSDLNKFLDLELSTKSVVMQAYSLEDDFINITCCCDVEQTSPKVLKANLLNALKTFGMKKITVSLMQEITSEEFAQNMRTAETSCDYEKKGKQKHYTWTDEFDTNYLRDDCYTLKESIFDRLTSKKQIFQEAQRIVADQSLLDELNRIFSSRNQKAFYGVPVHYKITASSTHSAYKIVEILVSALNNAKRLLGTRTNFLTPNATFHTADNDALHSLFDKSKGITTVFEMQATTEQEQNVEFADSKIWTKLSDLTSQYHRKNLIIFVEIIGETPNSKKLLSKFNDTLDILEINEGFGTTSNVEDYLTKLMYSSEYKEFADNKEVKQLLENVSVFNISTAYKLFETWKKNILKTKIYPAYEPLKKVILDKKEEEKTNPYTKELENLVGLEPVKKVVKQILTSFKLQKVRSQLGLENDKFSKHMIFTGNPGAAKTTVARLLAKLLATEGILESGNLVECGRSDLVGKYVGWTAKIVKEKFAEACGGVLFIDEAYALADRSNSFGVEAINTIVQEMENHRDNVIVIFAGYPEKMQDFLDKNEGLRSRIAFHVNFPDYNPEELGEILQLMAKSKGYFLDEDVNSKCYKIFKDVYQNPEFGNGRFVRNMLEQAIMQQSLRITEEYQDKPLTKEVVCNLQACDFDENLARPFQRRCLKRVGFAA